MRALVGAEAIDAMRALAIDRDGCPTSTGDRLSTVSDADVDGYLAPPRRGEFDLGDLDDLTPSS